MKRAGRVCHHPPALTTTHPLRKGHVMATGQCITAVLVVRLPLIGRCGHRRVVRGWTRVTETDFAIETAGRDWNLLNDGYAVRSELGTHDRGAELLHRVIYERHCGLIPAGMQVDHIDRDRLNNTPHNLRLVTPTQNRVNSKRRSNNTSGYVGVSWFHRNRKWGAKVRVDKRDRFLGLFPTAREAADAVNDAYATHYPHVPPPNP
jgi:hypothetical protein